MKTSNNKILTIAVVLLLIINIALVIFMVNEKNHDATKKTAKTEPFEMMVKELSMTEQQQKDYKQQKEEHLKNIKPLFDSLRTAKSAFYALVKEDNVSDSLVNVYGQRIANNQLTIDKITFAHFKKIRTLFTAEQQPKFDTFVQKMMQRGRKDSTNKK